MSATASTPKDAEAKNATTSARLFFLDLSAGGHCPQTLTLRFEDHHHWRPEVALMARCSISPLGTSTGPIQMLKQGQMFKRRPI
jgi:hypothetical protein